MQTVADKMTGDVVTCAAHEPLSDVAHRMWERNCGSVPVVDSALHPLGLLTDRDVCMAALLNGRSLHQISVEEALPGRQLLSCKAADGLDQAHGLMRMHQVRRLPVVDDEGALVGLLSLTDLAHPEGTAAARRSQADALLLTVAGITRPSGTPVESVLPAKRAAKARASKSKDGATSTGRTRTSTGRFKPKSDPTDG